MSHVTTIEVTEKYRIAVLKQMCIDNKWQWLEN